jgi:Uma2 family endonuclease
MVAHPKEPTMTVEQYRALEETSEVKHEYVHGYVYAMSGGTAAHDRIANNVRTAIDTQIGDGPCTLRGPDVLLRVSESIYYYPDAIVTCEETTDDAIKVTTPRLIIEEAADRGSKFANYQTLAMFEEYLLIDSRSQAVERFHRAAPGVWTYQRYAQDDAVTLDSIGLTCPVATFYRRTHV